MNCIRPGAGLQIEAILNMGSFDVKMKKKSISGACLQTIALVASLAGPALAGAATPLPAASSLASVGWWDGPRGADMGQTLGPGPQGYDLVVNKGGSANVSGSSWQNSTWNVTGLAETNLGIQGVEGPSLSASTSGRGFNVWGWAKVDAGATSSMWVRFNEVQSAPYSLSLIPVLFSASGVGVYSGTNLNPYNQLNMQAFLSVDSSDGMSDAFPADRFKVASQGINGAASFNDSVSLGLYQGYYNPFFEIRVNANCSSMAFGNNNLEGTAPTLGTADCSVQVKSNLTFDQAAFDANPGRYGAAAAFKLTDYYRIEYSANVAAVPEPESWAMLLAGLGALALRRRAGQTA